MDIRSRKEKPPEKVVIKPTKEARIIIGPDGKWVFPEQSREWPFPTGDKAPKKDDNGNQKP